MFHTKLGRVQKTYASAKVISVLTALRNLRSSISLFFKCLFFILSVDEMESASIHLPCPLGLVLAVHPPHGMIEKQHELPFGFVKDDPCLDDKRMPFDAGVSTLIISSLPASFPCVIFSLAAGNFITERTTDSLSVRDFLREDSSVVHSADGPDTKKESKVSKTSVKTLGSSSRAD